MRLSDSPDFIYVANGIQTFPLNPRHPNYTFWLDFATIMRIVQQPRPWSIRA